MSHRNISVKLSLRFVEGAFMRRDFANALYWLEVCKERIEAHEKGNVSPKTNRAIARANDEREAKRL